jgi:hypothetical protein
MNREPGGNRRGQYMGWGVGIVLAIGAGIGAAIDNIALGMGIGIAIGAGIGAAFQARGDDG